MSPTRILKLRVKDIGLLPGRLQPELVRYAQDNNIKQRLFPTTLPAASYIFRKLKKQAHIARDVSLREMARERKRGSGSI